MINDSAVLNSIIATHFWADSTNLDYVQNVTTDMYNYDPRHVSLYDDLNRRDVRPKRVFKVVFRLCCAQSTLIYYYSLNWPEITVEN